MSEVEQEVIEFADTATEQPNAGTRKLEPGAEAPPSRPTRAETKKLEPEAEVPSQVLAPVPHLGLTREEMTWAGLAHASILITLLLGIASGGIAAILGPIIPAIIWYVYRDKSEYVVEQARQANNLAEELGSQEDQGVVLRLLGEIAANWPGSGLGKHNPYFKRSIALLKQVGEQYELTQTQQSFDRYRQH